MVNFSIFCVIFLIFRFFQKFRSWKIGVGGQNIRHVEFVGRGSERHPQHLTSRTRPIDYWSIFHASFNLT